MLDGTSINMGNMGLKRTHVGLNKSLVKKYNAHAYALQ
jgi:hypothetical protein